MNNEERLSQILHDGHALAASMAQEWLDQVELLPRTIPASTESIVRGRDEKGRITSTETITHVARRRNYNTAVRDFMTAATATVSEHRPADAIFLDLVAPYLTTLARVKRLAASTDAEAFIDHAFKILGDQAPDYNAALAKHLGKAKRQIQRMTDRNRAIIEQAAA